MPYTDLDKRRANHRIASRKFSAKLLALKTERKARPCEDCGVSYPACVMDFDHRSDKKFGIGENRTLAWSRYIEEMDKCDVVCSNCHRLRTMRRRKANGTVA